MFFTVKNYISHYLDLNYGKIEESKKNAIIDQVITDAGLEKARNTKVGDAFIKGLSGGEKRRLSIALELIANP